MKVLVTGASGFIGYHLVRKLIESNFEVIGIDNERSSYGGNLAEIRSKKLFREFGFKSNKLDLADSDISEILKLSESVDSIVHLAAWPGVRQSSLNPEAYSRNNIQAFNRIIEIPRILKTNRFIYASSSSVYGNQGLDGPVQENNADIKNALSYYSLTKFQNEITANFYQENFSINTIGLRLFTVYGPMGRPDMAYWNFSERILDGRSIELYGHNGGERCFTYIDDVINSIFSLLQIDKKFFSKSVNISSGNPRATKELVELLCNYLGNKEVDIMEIDRPPEDAEKTWADISLLNSMIGYQHFTPLETGLEKFADWFLEFRNSKHNLNAL
jgi:UDP-glucuronate 4-epimerase